MKITILKSMMVVLMALSSLYVYAYDVAVNGICYLLDSGDPGTAIVTSGSKKYSGKVVIPKTFKYLDVKYTVTGIGLKAFDGCSSLTSVTIPNSVTSIDNNAFLGCI